VTTVTIGKVTVPDGALDGTGTYVTASPSAEAPTDGLDTGSVDTGSVDTGAATPTDAGTPDAGTPTDGATPTAEATAESTAGAG
jgi:hypothetical protein